VCRTNTTAKCHPENWHGRPMPNGTTVLPAPKKLHPAIWHGVTVPHGTTVPPASGFSAPISFFFSSIFLLLPHLFSLYDGKTLTSPPCYPPPHSNLHPHSSLFTPKLCSSFINLHLPLLNPSNLLNFSPPIFPFLSLKP